MYNNINNRAIPIKVRYSNKKGNDTKLQQEVNDYIGSYGTPNTYTADLPESIRKDRNKLDPSQRIAYKNPNHSYV